MTNPHRNRWGFFIWWKLDTGDTQQEFCLEKSSMTLIEDERIQTKFELESHSEGNLIYYENKQ